MFTLSDICDIAIQIEHNGEATYRRASRNAADPMVARLLEMMAEQERDHARWFERLDPACRIHARNGEIADMGRELLRNIMAQQTFSLDEQRLAESADLREVLSQSREFENDTILFYEMLHSFLDDSQTMQQLERIIEEEKSHIAQLDKMAAMLCAAKQPAQ